jgi:DNA polymerase III sliding clamp (beta) subunit (PCNA family)
MQNKLKFNKKDFKVFLDGLSKVNDTAILNVEEDRIHAISSSDDRSLFLWSSLNGDYGFEGTLNLPSLKKLSKCLDMMTDKEVEFIVNPNNLEYKGSQIRFKYHVYGDGILVAPKITLAKIESLEFDNEFTVSKDFLDGILKKSSIFKDTNKLYIYTDDGKLIWSLGDKTMMNTDVLTIEGDDVDFEMDEFILNLDNVRLLSFDGDALFRVNKIGIGSLGLINGKVELNYILSSLTR